MTQDVIFYKLLYDSQMSLTERAALTGDEERALLTLAEESNRQDLVVASALHRSDTLGTVRKFIDTEAELDEHTDDMNPDGVVLVELHKMKLGLPSLSMSDLAKTYDENFIKLQVMIFEKQLGIK